MGGQDSGPEVIAVTGPTGLASADTGLCFDSGGDANVEIHDVDPQGTCLTVEGRCEWNLLQNANSH